MATTHHLKTLPEHYNAVVRGDKLAELRKNDRNFNVGDCLLLKEWTESYGYTGRSASFHVIHVCDVGFIADGYVMLSITVNTNNYGKNNLD
ncbi:DUF3850 domain-containing protein [Plesiomonas shigelloides]|uniref:DUF3850 domain-containing protein n=1 Tax=Plesiomonas shigelloides TaxID=703 RepID=UPI0012629B50|nr:DUF3850 domain-containing protein [Plesiomonas shigelloides]KAB7710960.1 DUF3850 domain-containing protein [Plesiomonas shigelloides]